MSYRERPVDVLHAGQGRSRRRPRGARYRGLRLEIFAVPRRRVDRKSFLREVRPEGDLVRRPRALTGHVPALGGGGLASPVRRRALPGGMDGRVPRAGVPAGGGLIRVCALRDRPYLLSIP